MKARLSRSQPNRQIIEEACHWFVDFRAGDVDAKAREDFNLWLRRSPEHIQGYLQIAATYAEMAAPELGALDIEATIAHARKSPPPPDPLGGMFAAVEKAPLPAPSPRRGGPRAFPVAVAFTALACLLGAWLYRHQGIYSTGIGEQRSITLADGSTVDLNARSSIRVSLTESERRIELVQGQALFAVAKDKARPFIVRSADTEVRAVGTQFDMYRKKSATIVTVIEGRVAANARVARSTGKRDGASPQALPRAPVETGGGAATAPVGEMLLSAGQQLTVTSTAILIPSRANVAVATAWTQRRLVFENASLAEVADEFNRYNLRPLLVDSTDIRDFNISGSYSSTNPDALLHFLRAQPGLRVVETAREIRVSKATDIPPASE